MPGAVGTMVIPIDTTTPLKEGAIVVSLPPSFVVTNPSDVSAAIVTSDGTIVPVSDAQIVDGKIEMNVGTTILPGSYDVIIGDVRNPLKDQPASSGSVALLDSGVQVDSFSFQTPAIVSPSQNTIGAEQKMNLLVETSKDLPVNSTIQVALPQNFKIDPSQPVAITVTDYTGTRIPIENAQIVNNGNEVSVNLPDGMEAGSYQIQIDNVLNPTKEQLSNTAQVSLQDETGTVVEQVSINLPPTLSPSTPDLSSPTTSFKISPTNDIPAGSQVQIQIPAEYTILPTDDRTITITDKNGNTVTLSDVVVDGKLISGVVDSTIPKGDLSVTVYDVKPSPKSTSPAIVSQVQIVNDVQNQTLGFVAKPAVAPESNQVGVNRSLTFSFEVSKPVAGPGALVVELPPNFVLNPTLKHSYKIEGENVPIDPSIVQSLGNDVIRFNLNGDIAPGTYTITISNVTNPKEEQLSNVGTVSTVNNQNAIIETIPVAVSPVVTTIDNAVGMIHSETIPVELNQTIPCGGGVSVGLPKNFECLDCKVSLVDSNGVSYPLVNQTADSATGVVSGSVPTDLPSGKYDVIVDGLKNPTFAQTSNIVEISATDGSGQVIESVEVSLPPVMVTGQNKVGATYSYSPTIDIAKEIPVGGGLKLILPDNFNITSGITLINDRGIVRIFPTTVLDENTLVAQIQDQHISPGSYQLIVSVQNPQFEQVDNTLQVIAVSNNSDILQSIQVPLPDVQNSPGNLLGAIRTISEVLTLPEIPRDATVVISMPDNVKIVDNQDGSPKIALVDSSGKPIDISNVQITPTTITFVVPDGVTAGDVTVTIFDVKNVDSSPSGNEGSLTVLGSGETVPIDFPTIVASDTASIEPSNLRIKYATRHEVSIGWEKTSLMKDCTFTVSYDQTTLITTDLELNLTDLAPASHVQVTVQTVCQVPEKSSKPIPISAETMSGTDTSPGSVGAVHTLPLDVITHEYAPAQASIVVTLPPNFEFNKQTEGQVSITDSNNYPVTVCGETVSQSTMTVNLCGDLPAGSYSIDLFNVKNPTIEQDANAGETVVKSNDIIVETIPFEVPPVTSQPLTLTCSCYGIESTSKDVCSSRGKCECNDKCKCSEGFSGDSCQSLDPKYYPVEPKNVKIDTVTSFGFGASWTAPNSVDYTYVLTAESSENSFSTSSNAVSAKMNSLSPLTEYSITLSSQYGSRSSRNVTFTVETLAGASSKTGSIEVGQTQQVELTLKSSEPIPANGEIRIKLPSNFYFNSSSDSVVDSLEIIYKKTDTNVMFKNATLSENQSIISVVLVVGMRAGEFEVVLDNVQTPEAEQETTFGEFTSFSSDGKLLESVKYTMPPVVAGLHYTPQTSCQLGYMGDNCDIAICFGINATSPDVCNGNGVCSAPDHCKCFTGLTGQDCSSIGLDTTTIIIAAASAGGATALAVGCLSVAALIAFLAVRRRKKVQQGEEALDSSESSVDKDRQMRL